MAIKVSAINNMTSAKDSAILAFASDYLFREGVVNINSNDLKVTEQTPNAMAVDVEKGYVYVQNDAWVQGSNQPKYYRVEIDTKTGKSLTPNASANNWIVAICIKVDVGSLTPGADGELAGTIEAVYGTAAASPVAPAIPNHHYVLAYATYNSSHSVITNARLTDLRVYAGIDMLKIFPYPISEGQMINGKISPTVASNNLTLAVKTLAGNDPSASDPVYVMINGSLRTITSALSVTQNAGTNRFNAGSSELATKEIDYFAYLAWDSANSLVRLGFARIPYALIYSDFSGTSTAETFGAFNTNPGATDSVTVIGRFAATLSAGAGYTWTVPTFTTKNLIQRPIFETRILTWQPSYSASGSMTWTSVTTRQADYQIIGKLVTIYCSFIGTTGGTTNSQLFFTVPFTSAVTSNAYGTVTFATESSIFVLGRFYPNSATQFRIVKIPLTNWTLGAGMGGQGAMDYPIAL